MLKGAHTVYSGCGFVANLIYKASYKQTEGLEYEESCLTLHVILRKIKYIENNLHRFSKHAQKSVECACNNHQMSTK